LDKITLEKLIYKNYLKTSLTSIFFIELVLIVIYFTVSNNLINKSIDFVLTDLKQNIYKLVDERTKSIDRKLTEVELLAKVLQKEHQNFFEFPQNYNQIDKPKFQYSQNQMYYKTNNNGGSSVVVSKDTPIDEALKKELNNSELFDSTFKTLVEHDKNIVAVYFNSYKNYSRYYPYMDNFHELFPSSINMQAYNFYYEADEKNNPNKNVVMTDVYLDLIRKDWMLSVIVPIYNKNKLEGVSGIDITLKNFVDNYLNIDLPFNGKSFVINNSGKIIAMSKDIENLLNIKEIDEHVYKKDEIINETISKSNKFNILDYEDKDISNTFKNIIEDKTYSHKIKVNNQNYLLFTHKMEKTSWYVVSLIKEENVVKEIKSLKNYYDNLGYSIIVIIILFYVLFFFFLRFKAKQFVSQINTPLLEIIKLTKNIGKTREMKSLKSNEIVEIDELNNNFNNLISELNIRTNNLIIEETKRVYQEKLANTDTLTGAYNRRYLKEFSADYLKIVKREKKDLSLLILDLDDFKNINDTYGHEAGDLVLIEFVKLARKSIRDNDLIVRFGGDEFIVLLPNTNISNAKILANKIINKISEYNMNKQVKFSISIGVSQYEEKDNSIESLILRADDSLYEAKRKGKNCVI
jgi:diguanylate cyclase (GGDEF)-like protein